MSHQRIEALLCRLERTNEHLLGQADILQHYVQACRDHGMIGAAKALETAVGQLHIVARLNTKTINDTREQQL